jgi:hypothetical protein
MSGGGTFLGIGRRGRRRPRRDSGWGRFTRGLLEFVLVLVLLLFAASWMGLLEPRRRAAETVPEEGAGDLRVVPAVVTENRSGAAPGRSALRAGRPPSRARPPDEASAPAAAAIRVHLANGSGVPRLAASLREPMRAAGFDVCGAANADRSDYAETVVIDRTGDRGKADAVCRFLRANWGAGRVVLQARNSLESDVLVVLGRDLGEVWTRSAAVVR